MPAKTQREANFMRGCANSPSKMRGKCPSKSVAREFAHGPLKAGGKLKGLHKFQGIGK